MIRIFILYPIVCILLAGNCRDGSEDHRVRFTRDTVAKRVEVLLGSHLFTAYKWGGNLKKPILYPVTGPGGIIVTRGYPIDPRVGERVDHPHHAGVWFNFGDVNGYDFWNNSCAVTEGRRHHFGRIRHRKIVRAESRDGTGILETESDWLAPDTRQAVRLLTEKSLYRFSGGPDVRTIDRTTTLTAVTDTVVFRDNKEGLFAIRVDRALEHPSDRPVVLTDSSGEAANEAVLDNEGVAGWYRNSWGVEGPAVWGKRAEWVKLTGRKEGDTLAVILMDHPDNPNHPPCWHARGYGLFSVNNLGKQVYDPSLAPSRLVLRKGESVTFRHRIVVSAGDPADHEIREFHANFVKGK